MKHAIMGAVIASWTISLALGGSAQAQHMSNLDRAAADQALAAIGLDGGANPVITFDRATFRSGNYTFTNLVIQYQASVETGPASGDLPEGKSVMPASGTQETRLEEIHIARMILDSPRLDAAGNLLLHALVLEDIATSDDPRGIRVERIALEAPNPAMSADLGRALRGDRSDEIGSNWNLYQFGLLALENMSGMGREPDAVFALSLDRLAFIDYTAASLGRFEFLGFAVEGETETGTMTVALDEFSVDGLVTSTYAGLMDAMASGAGEAEMTRAYYATDIEDQMDLLDRAQMRGLNMVVPGLTLSLDELVVTMGRRQDVFDTHAHLGTLRMVPDPAVAEGAQIANAIGMLGYDSLELSLEANSVYDPQTGRAYTAGDNYFELRDGLRLDMIQDIGGYLDYFANLRSLSDTVEPDEEARGQIMLQALSSLTINRIGLRLQDRSMLDRAIAAGAASQGITPEEMRAQVSLMVPVGLLAAPPQVPRALLEQAATAISSFITNGGVLVIDIAPPDTLSVGDLIAQAEAETFDIEALGLSITAEPPARQ